MRHSTRFNWFSFYSGIFTEKLIKYKQYINNYKKLTKISNSEKEALILSSKDMFVDSMVLIKQYLKYNGLFYYNDIDIIREAFYSEIIEDGQSWIDYFFDMLNFNEIVKSNRHDELVDKIINKYVDCILQLDIYMESRYGKIWH